MDENKKNTELNEEQLKEVSGGQTEESVILAYEEKARKKVDEMKKLQSKVITSAGTMEEIVAAPKAAQ